MQNINKKKVVFISVDDYSGSGYQASLAVRKKTKFDAILIKFFLHRFDYKYDYCLLNKYADKHRDVPEESEEDKIDKLLKIQELINDADILHFKGDDYIGEILNLSYLKLKIPTEKPIVLTLSGTKFRTEFSSAKNSRQLPIFLEKVKRHTNACTALSPDLNYSELNGIFVPTTSNTEKYKNIWKPREVPIIGHAPSSRAMKKTNEVVLPAIEILKSKDIKLEFDLIENVTHRECLNRRKAHTIFIERGGSLEGTYGNSAVESAQFGIPTLCPISENSLRRSGGKLNDCAIINFDPTPEGLALKLENLISNSNLDIISKKTKKWANDFHGYTAIGKLYEEIYDNILDE